MNSAYSVQYNNVRRTWILIFFFVALVTSSFFLLGWVYDNYLFPIFGLFLSVGQSLVGYFLGDKIALSFAKAREIKFEEAPQIHNIVENISRIAGIPKPKIYISPDPSANAFACGRSPKYASICLNQGLLKILDKSELEGVIAHEIAHIKNRDILLMTVIMVLSSLISFVADIGMRLMILGDRDNDKGKNPVLIILYITFLILAPLVSLLIQMAISRSREYLADATAVVFTRYPTGLIRALEKISTNPIPTTNYSTAMNHLYISEPKRVFGEDIKNIFSTHPPIKDRIAKLSQMA